MSLEAFFGARSIAVVGASSDPLRIGGRPIDALKREWLPRDAARRIYPVNPSRTEIQGLPAFPSAVAISEPVDLAIVAVPAHHVEAAVKDCAAAGAGGAVIFSSGFGETGAEGLALQDRIAAAAREAGMRLVGPNCLGLVDMRQGLLATFSDSAGFAGHRAGPVGIASQSGAVMSQMLMLARRRRVGLGKALSTGNECDVDLAEAIRFLVADPDTACILAYCETARRGEALIEAFEAARAAAKPVIMLKAGRSEAGRSAALSHTGSMAGEDRVFDAVFRQHGVWRASSLEEAIDIAYVVSRSAPPAGRRLGAMTISGGAGVLMADEAAALGADMPPPPPETCEKLARLLPYAAIGNPLDTTAQAVNQLEAWSGAAELLMDAGYDALLMYLAYFGQSERMYPRLAEAMAPLARRGRPPLVFCSLFDEKNAMAAEEAGFLVFEEPGRALRALSAWMDIHERLRRPAPPAPPPPAQAAVAPGALGEYEAKLLAARFGLPIPQEALARSEDEAAAAAAGIGFPVVLKINSPDIAHKTEAGGVELDVPDEAAAREAFRRIRDNVAARRPDARTDGVIVAQKRRGGVELILGSIVDPIFGTIVMVGAGGVLTELMEDVSLRRAPVGPADAEEMLGELRAARLLDGFRGAPPADRAALVKAIVDFSALALSLSGRATMEINPLLAGPDGCVALDAAILPVAGPPQS